MRTAVIGSPLLKSEANTATPSAAPTWRLAFRTPAPIPERAGGTLARMAAFIEGATRPAPLPMSARGKASKAKEVACGSEAKSEAPPASRDRPTRMGVRVP